MLLVVIFVAELVYGPAAYRRYRAWNYLEANGADVTFAFEFKGTKTSSIRRPDELTFPWRQLKDYGLAALVADGWFINDVPLDALDDPGFVEQLQVFSEVSATHVYPPVSTSREERLEFKAKREAKLLKNDG